ncbi:uncharacterized protein IUM83_10768 [Phytophthora cinnamomi]|uniref:uncharacterized protein n=1 Tax=Phytophthora cinnamomi TaxID=4785 RepID=UPI00355A7DA4|nr:hypothetical protein IUM83_10768 [Phytophthora cinnamomi]
MATSRDGEPETGASIHRKRPREAPLQWRPEASQELLRLRFRQLRALFDGAETVADVHEAWGVVAARINECDGLLDEPVDAVKCSDQLTRLRQQWQDNSTAQLHLMMAECFSKSVVAAPTQPQQQVRSSFNREMEEALGQEAETARSEASPKRKRPTETAADEIPQQAETTMVVDEIVVSTPPPPEPEPVSPQEDIPVSEPASLSPEPVPPEEKEVPAEAEEEFPRQDEIMRALEKRSERLEKLARSHQTLAEATQKLMEAMVNRSN